MKTAIFITFQEATSSTYPITVLYLYLRIMLGRWQRRVNGDLLSASLRKQAAFDSQKAGPEKLRPVMRGSTVLWNEITFGAKFGLDLLFCSHLLLYWVILKSKINMPTKPILLSLLLLFSHVKWQISTNIRCTSFVTLKLLEANWIELSKKAWRLLVPTSRAATQYAV